MADEYKRGHYDEAIVKYVAEDTPAGYSNASLCALIKHRPHQALDFARKAIALKGDWYRGYQRGAVACLRLGKVKQAQEWTEEAIRLSQGQNSDELRALNKQVQEAQGDPLSDVSPLDAATEFRNWLALGGARFEDVTIRMYAAGYRGVHAARDIAKDTRVIEIPEDMILSPQVAAAESKWCGVVSEVTKNTHATMACALLERPAKWMPYINMLPKTYDEMPTFWVDDPKRNGWIKGTHTATMAAAMRQNLKASYEELKKANPEWSVSLDEYIWARLAVSTRTFAFRKGSGSDQGPMTQGLVPLADLLNHMPKANVVWSFDSKRRAFVMIATENISAGQVVYDSYGLKSNNVLFADYGFALEGDNVDSDVAMFRIHDGEMTIKASAKAETTVRTFRLLREAVLTNKLSVHRADEKETKRLPVRELKDTEDPAKVDTKETELSILGVLASTASGALQQYTPLTDLVPELKSDKPTRPVKQILDALEWWQQCCLRVRKSEESIYHFYIELYQYVQSVRDVDIKELKRKHKNKSDLISVYMTNVWFHVQ